MKWAAVSWTLLVLVASSGCWRPYYGYNYAQPAYTQPPVYSQPAPVYTQPAPVYTQPAAVYAQPQVMQNPCCQPNPCCVGY